MFKPLPKNYNPKNYTAPLFNGGLFFICIFFLHSCKTKEGKAEAIENKIEVPKDDRQFEKEMTTVLQAYIDNLQTTRDDKNKYLSWHSAVKDFYSKTDFHPLWTSKNVLSPKGKEMLEYLGNAEYLGLNKSLYNYEVLRHIADSAYGLLPEINFTLEKEMEVGLSSAFLHIALHIEHGMFADTIQGINANFWNSDVKYISLLQKVQSDSISKLIGSLEPNNPAYNRYMAGLRTFVSKNNISSTPIHIRNPKTDSLGAVGDAKIALVYHHFLPDSLKQNDSAFLSALKQFQKENNLNGDGAIGANTIKALERDNSKKFQLLAINADRWRKEHIVQLPEKYVWVNLPSFKVKIIENDTIRLMKNTVIGKSNLKNETPILESAINQIVLWPTWSVPQSIVKHEMKSFNGYVVTKNGNYTSVVQPPGLKNALGAVKILFPNKYSVYMHDTPSKGLFNADFRAASHGCVRCQDALEIAAYLMSMDTFQMPYDSLKAMKDRKIETKTFRLKKAIPVYFRYFTAEADYDGAMKFYADVYNRDKDMINFIFNGKQPHQLTKEERRERQIKDSLFTQKKRTDSLLAEAKKEAPSQAISPKVTLQNYSPKADTASAKHDSL
jgi:murein L,D-transpeptidase YcbB/YkuD